MLKPAKHLMNEGGCSDPKWEVRACEFILYKHQSQLKFVVMVGFFALNCTVLLDRTSLYVLDLEAYSNSSE